MQQDRPLWVPTKFYIPGKEKDLDVTLPLGGPMFRKGDVFTWDNLQMPELSGYWEVQSVSWGLGGTGQWYQTLVLGRVQ